MIIEIPHWLVATVTYILLVTILGLLLAACWWFIVCRIVWALRNRKAFYMARVFLTFKSHRAAAVEYTWHELNEVLKHMAEHNPDRFENTLNDLNLRLEGMGRKITSGDRSL